MSRHPLGPGFRVEVSEPENFLPEPAWHSHGFLVRPAAVAVRYGLPSDRDLPP